MVHETKLDLKLPLATGETLEVYDVDCEIHYSAHKGYPASKFDPGEPNYVTIERIMCGDINVTNYANVEYAESLIDPNEALYEGECNYADHKLSELREVV